MAELLLPLLGAALLAGLARGFSGFGAALIFMPLAGAVVGPASAAAILLAADSLASLGMLPDAWRRANRSEVATMSAGAVFGVPLGAWLLTRVDPLAMRWIVVGLVAAMLGLLLSGGRYRSAPRAPVTAAVGALSGLMSGATQIGGPPVVAYWLGGPTSLPIVRANIILYFAIASLLAIAAYWIGGVFTQRTLLLASLVVPAYGAALYAGARFFAGASPEVFRRICYGLIAAAAIIGLPAFDGVFR